jgi:hypothetical protein
MCASVSTRTPDPPAAETAPRGMGLAEATAVYSAFRGYVVHEDDLVHQRTTWSIAIQTFAVATFGLIFQRTMEAIAALGGPTPPVDLLNLVADRYRFILLLVAGFGLGVSLISGIAVYAAQKAISRLQRVWVEKHFNIDPICDKFPPLTGGAAKFP